MSRPVLVLLLLVLLLVVGMFVLAGRTTERQPVMVEKAVALENLAN